MASHPAIRFLQGVWPPKPWLVMGIGVAITLVGLALAPFGDALAGVRFVFFLVGLITAGVGVSLRLRTAGQAFDERLESAGVLAVGAFAALLAYLGTDKAWDSLQMALVALVLVALLGVVLVLLPTPARMIVVSVLAVVHLGGMISAANDMAPPNGGPPWVAHSLHQYFYRPYLEFMYLNNAYHFYSPQPGAPSVVWFHIKYKDGQAKWFKVPNRDEDPVPMHHVRLMSIAESTSGANMQTDIARMTLIRTRRDEAGKDPNDPTVLSADPRHPGYGIPIAPDYIMLPALQYQEPTEFARKIIESYARHVAHTFPTLGSPDNTIQSIKVYRFRHNVLLPGDMAQNRNPLDPTMFAGFYEGEFDKEGKMLHPDLFELTDASLAALGAAGLPKPVLAKLQPLTSNEPMDRERFRAELLRALSKDDLQRWQDKIEYQAFASRQDPFLYWYVPIYYQPDGKLVDSLRKQAQLDLDKPPDEQKDDPNDSPWTDGAEKPR